MPGGSFSERTTLIEDDHAGGWLRRFALARVAAIGQVTMILLGWCFAQYPNLITPDVTVTNSAAPEATLRLLILALGLGAILLFPSLIYLFHIFKGKPAQEDHQSM